MARELPVHPLQPVRAARRYWVLIVACAGIVGLALALLTSLTSPTYAVEAKLRLLPVTDSTAGGQSSESPERRLANGAQLLQSDVVLGPPRSSSGRARASSGRTSRCWRARTPTS